MTGVNGFERLLVLYDLTNMPVLLLLLDLFNNCPPSPLWYSRESPPLLCYTLPRYYLAYSLDSRIIV